MQLKFAHWLLILVMPSIHDHLTIDPKKIYGIKAQLKESKRFVDRGEGILKSPEVLCFDPEMEGSLWLVLRPMAGSPLRWRMVPRGSIFRRGKERRVQRVKCIFDSLECYPRVVSQQWAPFFPVEYCRYPDLTLVYIPPIINCQSPLYNLSHLDIHLLNRKRGVIKLM